MQNFYIGLAKANKLLLPSLSKRRVDLTKAKKWQLALFAYKLWVVKKALD
ncbi:MAG: SsrA-binding protein [Gilvibacter sp.]